MRALRSRVTKTGSEARKIYIYLYVHTCRYPIHTQMYIYQDIVNSLSLINEATAKNKNYDVFYKYLL